MSYRTEKTKMMLVQVFVEKLAQDSFKEITISEIAAEAGCSRNTFYRYFKDKYDLIAYFFNQLLDNYLLELKEELPSRFEELLTFYFTFWKRNASAVNLFRNQQLSTFILEIYSQKMLEFLEISDFPWHQSTKNDQLILLITIGGCWNILQYHLKNGIAFDPKQLSHHICQQIIDYKNFL